MIAPDFQIKTLPKYFVSILLVSLIVKLILSAMLPLTSDETYYWVWSHHMQMSFFDHPPAVAWLFWLSQPFENLGSAVRWAGVLLGHGTLVLWLLILRKFLNERQLKVWLWLALLSPLIGAGSLLITPDTPLLFFWALTLLLFLRWLENPDFKNALFLGISCGLGFCSKYIMVLQPMFLFFATLFISEWRKKMVRSAFVIGLGVVFGSTPVWLWNVMNDFASIRFQAQHGLGREFWKPSWTYEYILVQVALIFPTVFYFAVRATKSAPIWLWLLAWGPLAFFVFTSYRGYVEANWPIVAYAEVFALAAMLLPLRSKSFRTTVGIWAASLASILFLIITRWSPTGEPIKTKEFFEFEPLRPIAAQMEPVYARSYQMASQLSFDLKKSIYKLRGMNRHDFFDELEGSQPKTEVFYVLAEKVDTLPKEIVESGYKVTAKTPVAGSDIFEVWEVRR